MLLRLPELRWPDVTPCLPEEIRGFLRVHRHDFARGLRVALGCRLGAFAAELSNTLAVLCAEPVVLELDGLRPSAVALMA
jgi:hypothetical protein